MQRMIGRAAAVTMVLCPLLVGGSVSAHADRPAVQKRSCEAAGGSFSMQRGMKGCTRSEQETLVSSVLTRSVRLEGGPRTGPSVDMVGTYRVVRVVERTTTQSQRGNSNVVTTSSERELSSTIEPLTCRRVLADMPEPRPSVDDSIANCARAGVYPT